jgi:hypothetical protein
MRESRNLLLMQDSTRRRRLLYRGQVAIVACLSRLPKTQHDLPSVAVDLTLFTVSLGYSLLVQQALLGNVHMYTCSLHSLLLYISFLFPFMLPTPWPYHSTYCAAAASYSCYRLSSQLSLLLPSFSPVHNSHNLYPSKVQAIGGRLLWLTMLKTVQINFSAEKLW